MERADLTQARGKACMQRDCEGVKGTGGIIEALDYFWVESCNSAARNSTASWVYLLSVLVR